MLKRHPLPQGHTLMELMVTVAIVAILATIGIPTFRDVVMDGRLVSNINQFVGSVNYARSHAINHLVSVTLCSSTSPLGPNPSCDGGRSWESGWIIFTDHDRDGVIDLGTDTCATGEDCILRVQEALSTSTFTGGRTRITYALTGTSVGFNGTWVLCDNRGNEHARASIISNSGRLRRAVDEDDDGIVENGSRNPVTCP